MFFSVGVVFFARFRLLFPHSLNIFIIVMTKREHKCARLFIVSVVLNVSDDSVFFIVI